MKHSHREAEILSGCRVVARPAIHGARSCLSRAGLTGAMISAYAELDYRQVIASQRGSVARHSSGRIGAVDRWFSAIPEDAAGLLVCRSEPTSFRQ